MSDDLYSAWSFSNVYLTYKHFRIYRFYTNKIFLIVYSLTIVKKASFILSIQDNFIQSMISPIFWQAISEYHQRHSISTCLRRVRASVRAHGLSLIMYPLYIRGIKFARLLRAYKRHVKVTVRKRIFGFIKPHMITSR